MDNLQKRGMYLPNICPLCYRDVESVDHIFLHCSYVSEVWGEIMMEAGIDWVFPRCLWDSFLSWKVRKLSPRSKVLWSLVFPSVCWTIWLDRNQTIFENHAELAYNIFRKAKDLLCFWATSCKEMGGSFRCRDKERVGKYFC